MRRWKAFEKLLNPEQLKAVEDKLDSEADVLTLPDEKRMEYPYRNICNTLKANASKVIPNNPEKLKEYEDALSYASEHINMPSNAYRDELKKQEADGEKVTGEYEKSVKAKFTDGKYRDLYVEKNLNGKTEKVVENDKKDLLEDLKTNTYQMSEA